MPIPLRILLVEDSDDDTALILHELRRAGYETVHERVDTGPAMAAALRRGGWQLVTCDCCMPNFSAPAARRLLAASGLDVPFVVVSGVVDEELAEMAMKVGARAYVSKHDLPRLATVLADIHRAGGTPQDWMLQPGDAEVLTEPEV